MQDYIHSISRLLTKHDNSARSDKYIKASLMVDNFSRLTYVPLITRLKNLENYLLHFGHLISQDEIDDFGFTLTHLNCEIEHA